MCTKTELYLRIDEIAGQFEDGLTRQEIIEKGIAKWAVTERTVERYLAFARDVIAGRMKKKEAVIEAMRSEAIADAVETWLKSDLEIEARLCEIIEGQVEGRRIIESKNGDVKITRYNASPADIIRAIDKLWKVRGRYNANVIAAEKPVIMTYKLESEEDKKLLELE